MMLAATACAATIVALGWPGRLGRLAAALFLFTPNAFYTDPEGGDRATARVSGLVVVALVATRWPRWIGWAFGAFLALKQYALLALPCLSIPGRRPRTREVGRLLAQALGIVLLTTVPFFAWNPEGFARSLVAVQLAAPFLRLQALSFAAAIAQAGGPGARRCSVGFAAGGIFLVLCLRPMPRSPSGIVATIGIALFAFFAFNKQAFPHYYFFCMGAFACALAAAWQGMPVSRQPMSWRVSPSTLGTDGLHGSDRPLHPRLYLHRKGSCAARVGSRR